MPWGALGCPGVPWGALPGPPGGGFIMICHQELIYDEMYNIYIYIFIYLFVYLFMCIICICIYIYMCVCKIYILIYICEVIAIAWSDFPKLTY